MSYIRSWQYLQYLSKAFYNTNIVRMYLCMYVCMYSICTYVRMYVCMHVYMALSECMFANIDVCMHVCFYIWSRYYR